MRKIVIMEEDGQVADECDVIVRRVRVASV